MAYFTPFNLWHSVLEEVPRSKIKSDLTFRIIVLMDFFILCYFLFVLRYRVFTCLGQLFLFV